MDPGVYGDEIAALANDLRELGQPVVAGFSTHPHWESPALARRARLGASLRHGPLRGRRPSSAVGRGLEGSHRRVDSARHRGADFVGPVRPHYQPARRNCADSLGWPSSPDRRASSACPGPCGPAD
ncbi:MAG TPA: hypothetical protein VMA72_02810 [Streptosporangiaceae bacterium]|nr:hypothetical protein [Streptosporangiaceae bacterium]